MQPSNEQEGVLVILSRKPSVFTPTQVAKQTPDQACWLTEALQHWCASFRKPCREFSHQQVFDPVFAVP